MNDLISRKALNEAISYALYSSIRLDVSDIRDIINNQPTAYDVDKVVEQLDDYLFEKHCIEGDGEPEEIIKGGGVDE